MLAFKSTATLSEPTELVSAARHCALVGLPSVILALVKILSDYLGYIVEEELSSRCSEADGSMTDWNVDANTGRRDCTENIRN